MEVGVKVVTENIRDRVVRHANSCFLTMVAVDDQGKSVEVPPWRPATPIQRRRHHAAELRRALRRELSTRFEEARTAFPGAED